jgi:hypothetical protein
VTGFGLSPATAGGMTNWACADVPNTIKMDAETINVAENTDLMTNPKVIREGILKRSLTSGQLSTSAWSATTAPRFRELCKGLD